jgi:hypothetical protein
VTIGRVPTRQGRARPFCSTASRWLRERLRMCSLQPDTMKVINYMLDRLQVLNYCCKSGVAEIETTLSRHPAGVANFLPYS